MSGVDEFDKLLDHMIVREHVLNVHTYDEEGPAREKDGSIAWHSISMGTITRCGLQALAVMIARRDKK